jgi:hypothetical protein
VPISKWIIPFKEVVRKFGDIIPEKVVKKQALTTIIVF